MRHTFRFDASGFVLLAVDGRPLTRADRGLPILLLDSTWRLLPQLESCIVGTPSRRSLPVDITTAYPRRSKTSRDPEAGLASVEAIYIAERILGEDDRSLLEAYRWRDVFLDGVKRVDLFSAEREI